MKKTLLFAMLTMSLSVSSQVPVMETLYAQEKAMKGLDFDFFEYSFVLSKNQTTKIVLVTNYHFDERISYIIKDYFGSLVFEPKNVGNKEYYQYTILLKNKNNTDYYRRLFMRIVYQYVKDDFLATLNFNADKEAETFMKKKIKDFVKNIEKQ